jgi:hypothetical protein
VTLNTRAKQPVARRHVLRLTIRAAYVPVSGAGSAVSALVTIKPPLGAERARRAATRARGGRR